MVLWFAIDVRVHVQARVNALEGGENALPQSLLGGPGMEIFQGPAD
jgi:hypothetical protein